MYQVSEAYNIAIEKRIRTDKVQGTITLKSGTIINFTDKDIQSGTLKIDNQCVNGEELEFGCVYAGQLSMSITTDIDRYKIYDAEVYIEYRLLLDNGTWETIPMGKYYVTEAIRKQNIVNIKALDGMIKFNGDYDGTTVSGTVYEILGWICDKCNMQLASKAEYFEGLPNGNKNFQLDSKSGTPQYRDCIAVLAQICACFATVDRQGQLRFVEFAKQESYKVPDYQRYETEISDFVTNYMGLRCLQSAEAIESFSEDTDNGLIMTIQNNPFLEYGLAETKQGMVDNIFNKLKEYSYTPSNVRFIGNPALECGDKVEYIAKGISVYSFITNYIWEYRGKHTLTCIGKNPGLTSVQSKQEKQFSQLSKDIAKSASAIIAYENLQSYKLTDKSTQIIRMNIVTTEDTSVLFSASVVIEVGSESDEIIEFIYELNNIIDSVFVPKQSIRNGVYTITLFYPILELKGKTLNVLRLYTKVSGGDVTINEQNIKAAISGQGMIVAPEVPWDGTLEFAEWYEGVSVQGEFAVGKFVDNVNTTFDIHDIRMLTDVYKLATLDSNFGLVGVSDLMEVNHVTNKNTITVSDKSKMVYSPIYVKVMDKFELETKYVFMSDLEEIDEGSLCKLEIDLEQFTRVDNIEVVKDVS